MSFFGPYSHPQQQQRQDGRGGEGVFFAGDQQQQQQHQQQPQQRREGWLPQPLPQPAAQFQQQQHPSSTSFRQQETSRSWEDDGYGVQLQRGQQQQWPGHHQQQQGPTPRMVPPPTQEPSWQRSHHQTDPNHGHPLHGRGGLSFQPASNQTLAINFNIGGLDHQRFAADFAPRSRGQDVDRGGPAFFADPGRGQMGSEEQERLSQQQQQQRWSSDGAALAIRDAGVINSALSGGGQRHDAPWEELDWREQRGFSDSDRFGGQRFQHANQPSSSERGMSWNEKSFLPQKSEPRKAEEFKMNAKPEIGNQPFPLGLDSGSRYGDGKLPRVDIPKDFQRQSGNVWKSSELHEIPQTETKSFYERREQMAQGDTSKSSARESIVSSVDPDSDWAQSWDRTPAKESGVPAKEKKDDPNRGPPIRVNLATNNSAKGNFSFSKSEGQASAKWQETHPPKQQKIFPSIQSARVKEYLNRSCGVLEVTDPTCEGKGRIAFFHSDAVVAPPRPTSSSMGEFPPLPVGASVLLRAVELRDNKYFGWIGTSVWLKTSSGPPHSWTPPRTELLEKHLQNVMQHLAMHEPVFAAVDVSANSEQELTSASVREVCDDSFGLIDIRLTRDNLRFVALFHKEDLYLKDGTPAVKSKMSSRPLSELVFIGQPCSLSARSITTAKGIFLQSSYVMCLQAITVSLNPEGLPATSPRPTMIDGGPGLLSVSSVRTPCFFNQELPRKLNERLVIFLKSSGRSYPDLDPNCLSIPAIEKNPGGDDPMSSSLQAELTGQIAIVERILDKDSAILEEGGAHNGKSNWKCFVKSEHLMASNGRPLGLLLQPGMKVRVNASLINSKNLVQYLASIVWAGDSHPTPQDIQESKRKINVTSMLEQYTKVNSLYGIGHQQQKAEVKGKELVSARQGEETMPDYYERQIGTVSRLLDDNFGLIQVDQTTILFDVCDFWLDPIRTASKENLSIGQVAKVGSMVVFHAALLEKAAKVQYLATSVWLKDSIIASQVPKSILKETIHLEKIEIYRMVVRSLFDESATTKEDHLALEPPESKRVRMGAIGDRPELRSGVVRLVLVEDEHPIGGVIEFNVRKFCFFLVSNCLRISEDHVRAGLKVSFFADRTLWNNNKMEFVATTVFGAEDAIVDLDHSADKAKFDTSVSKMTEIIQSLGPDASRLLTDPSVPLSSSPPVLSLPSTAKSQDENRLGMEVESVGRFKCLFSDRAGLLEDKDKDGSLIYFEATDLNLAGEVRLNELATHLLGVEVSYHASLLSESGPIRYVVHDKGVRLTGRLPRSLKITEVGRDEMTPVSFRSREKRRRYQEAKVLFESGDFRDLQLEAELRLPRDLARRTGIVKYVLNENFALIRSDGVGDDCRSLCLFDTYDLYVSEGRTAADEGLNIPAVVGQGAAVEFNACLIKRDSQVPYLATAVWVPGKVSGVPLPLGRKDIQSSKVDIYLQVIQSCQSILTKKAVPPEKHAEEKSALLKDAATSGEVSEEKSDEFAILTLSNGERALLSIHRAWIGGRQLYGGWQPLRGKTMRVNARRVPEFAPDFEYQVSFCFHSDSASFGYSFDMKDWIGFVSTLDSMEEDLELYRRKFRNVPR